MSTSREQGTDWLARLNAAVASIESQLDGNIDYAKAAQIACCPLYHFTRMFSLLSGMPLHEYVRRRRLTLAAADLAQGARVLDVSVKYGYDSPTAFNRAFRAVHGVAPSAAKQPGVRLVSHPPMRFQITIKGEVHMEYKIVEMPAFSVVGKRIRTTTENGENARDIPAFWATFGQKEIGEIASLINTGPKGLLGVCAMVGEKEMDYYIAAATTSPAPAGMDSLEVGPASWAVFEAVGPMPTAIQDTWKRIYADWFPSSGFEYASGRPDLEVYPAGNTNAADYTCEVWIPVVKK